MVLPAMRSPLRALVALVLVTALVAFLGAPLCFSSACPMSGAERGACKAMGRECCGTKAGQVSHAPAAPALALAVVPAALALAAPLARTPGLAALSRAVPAPAVLQGIGLFTLLAVFLI
jgi:hypothetical protein